MVTLFVAMSHSLTPEQIEGFQKQYGSYYEDGGVMYPHETKVVSLRDTAPELQAKASNLNPNALLLEVKALAGQIVEEAKKVKATHFSFAGEPSLFFWATMFANEAGLCVLQSTTERVSVETPNPDGTVVKTSVFRHVQWRQII